MNRRKRIGWSIVAAGALGSACAHMQNRPRSPLPPPPKRHRSAKKLDLPPRNPVRWLLGGAANSWTDAIPTKRGILYVSSRGERVLVEGGKLRRSPFWLPDVTSGLASGKRYGFIQASGGVTVTRSLLGPPVLQREPPGLYIVKQAAVGRKAFVMVTRTLEDERAGPVLRSIDFGRTWTATAKDVEGIPVDVAMNHAGQGLLLTLPQAVWRTDDDGVTWHRMASTGNGVNHVHLGKGGSLWTSTFGALRLPWSGLDGHVLRDGHAHLLQSPFGSSGPDDESSAPVQYLAADRIVMARNDKAGLGVATQPLDGVAPLTWHTLPTSKGCFRPLIAGYGNATYVGCQRTRQRFTVWSSIAGGRWKHDFDFHMDEIAKASLIAGPGGWLFAAGGVRVHPGENPVPTNLGYDVWHSVTIGSAVYLLDCDETSCTYARATPAEPIPKPKSFTSDSGELDAVSLSDVQGQPLAVVHTSSGLFKVDPWATDKPKLEKDKRLPQDALRVFIHGRRGLALTERCKVYESRDGGAHWKALENEPFPGSLCQARMPDIAWCTDHGCQLGLDIRLGWRLDGASPREPVGPSSVPAPAPGPATTHVACTVSGPVRRAPDVENAHDLLQSLTVGGPIHWLAPGIDRDVWMVGEAADGKRLDVHLLPIVPKHRWRYARMRSRITPEGVIVVRELQSKNRKNGKSAPVSADIASYRYSTHHVTRARIANVGSLSRYALIGWVHDSVWYMPAGKGPAFVVGPGGRVTRRPLQDDDMYASAVVDLPTGPAGWTFDPDADLGELSAGGRHVRWQLGDSARPGTWNGVPAVGVDTFFSGHDFANNDGFAVELGMSPDPHVVAHVTAADIDNIPDHACEPGASGGVVTSIANLARVSMQGNKDPWLGAGLVRLRPGRPPCVEGLVTPAYNDDIAYVRADRPSRSYLFKLVDHSGWKSLSERAISCRLESAHGP